MLKRVCKLIVPEKHPVDERVELLVEEIFYTSGPHIRKAYTYQQVLKACLELAEGYPASMEVTLYALRSGNTELSKYFVEKLAEIGREDENDDQSTK